MAPPRSKQASPSSNLEAARTGDRRQALEQLRDTLAAQLDVTATATHAQLAAQYRATLQDLAELEVPQVRSGGVDELRARREKGRRATADASGNA